MNEILKGQVAIVTGAGRGIGREYSRALAAAGAAIVVAELNEDDGVETAELIAKDGGSAVAVCTDVADESSTQAMVHEALSRFGQVDILVNNAGMWGGLQVQTMTDISLELWNRVQAVNLTGMWLTAKAVAPSMAQRGCGVIINQSSIGGYTGGPYMAHYCTSKGAVNALTKALARELGPAGIRVNAIAPGMVTTEATLQNVPEAGLDLLVGQQCLKRRGDTTDLVGPLVFLASDASKFVTGQVLVVDGGLVMLG